MRRKTSPESTPFNLEDFQVGLLRAARRCTHKLLWQLEPTDIDPGIISALLFDRIDETRRKLDKISTRLWEWRAELKSMLSNTLTADEAVSAEFLLWFPALQLTRGQDEEDYQNRAEAEEKVDILLDFYRQIMSVFARNT